MKVTFHVGKAGSQLNQHHNRRDEKERKWNKDGHIDRALTDQNKTLIDVDLHKGCMKLFREPVEAFNEKNKAKHPERLKDLQSVCKDAESKVREIIIQVGNKDEQLSREQYDAFFEEALEDFRKNNKNLAVFGAYIHYDETTPHMHLDFIPLAHSNRGMSIKASLEGALKELGYKETGKYTEHVFAQWLDDTRYRLEDLAKPYIEKSGHNIEYCEPSGKGNCIQHQEFYQSKIKELDKELDRVKAELEITKKRLEFYNIALGDLEKDFQRHLLSEDEEDLEL